MRAHARAWGLALAACAVPIGCGDSGLLTVSQVAGVRLERVVAPPIGLTVMEAGNAGTLYIDPGDAKTFELPLLSFPSLGALPVTAVSLDPAVATVSPGAQVIPTGERAITLTVTATAAGDAETRIDLQVGVDRRTLRVVVGVPDAATAPTTIAPPVGFEIPAP